MESIVSPFLSSKMGISAQAKREAPRAEASWLGFAKSRSPPKPLTVAPSADPASHKKTMSLVSYSSEDSDSDADL